MDPFVLRAQLATPIIRRGYVTLDALLMAVLGRGDVSDLVRCDDGLYYASAGTAQATDLRLTASFVASMRPEHTPEWTEVITPNTLNKDLPVPEGATGRSKLNDIRIGLARQREAGNIINAYPATVTSYIEWYATGHGELVLDALKDVPFIGKRRTSGYGEVLSWQVEPGELDGLCGYLGEPLRPVPVDRWNHGGDWVPVEAAWKAPYWDVRSRTKCYVPSET